MGSPASGRAIDVGAAVFMRVVSGKVAEIRAVFDQVGLLKQIGALPAD
jgi:predicted ester cyclase